MKTISLISAGLLFAIAAVAQTPAPEPDTIPLPVEQGDPVQRTFPSHNYLEGFVRVMPDELPAAVRTTLESGSSYDGWRRAPIYKNPKGDRFIVEITTGGKTETFQFNAQGRPVPFDQ